MEVQSTIGYLGGHSPGGGSPKRLDGLHMNKLQYVQYECIKTELKEEYDKRINFLHRRIERRQT